MGDVSGKEMNFFPTLSKAVDYFEKSEIASQLLGQEVKEFLLSFYKSELAAYEAEITEWEQNRYFDKF